MELRRAACCGNSGLEGGNMRSSMEFCMVIVDQRRGENAFSDSEMVHLVIITSSVCFDLDLSTSSRLLSRLPSSQSSWDESTTVTADR